MSKKRNIVRVFSEPFPVEKAKWIPLTQGQFALIDEEDFDLVNQYNWYCHKKQTGSHVKYAQNKSDRNPIISMHRLLLNFPKNQIDHKNGNGLDNRKNNLRIVNNKENRQNSPIYKNNKSGFKGVRWKEDHNKWQARIRLNKKEIFLGYFDTKEKAAKAYNEAALRYFGEFARLNEIPDDK